MKHGIPVFDGDGHVLENIQEIDGYYEGEYTAKDNRLYGVGLTPINDIEAGKKEIIRCAKDRENFVAMLLPSVVANGKSFGDAFYWPLYEEAQRQGIPMTFHGGP